MQHKTETAPNQTDSTASPATDKLRLIKKYPNRRLYDTRTSSYITLADVKELVLKHEQFQVVDAKTSDDLTAPTSLEEWLIQFTLTDQHDPRPAPQVLLTKEETVLRLKAKRAADRRG